MDSELSVIRRAIAGDEGALRALWTRHAPHIDVVVRRLVGTGSGSDADLAADIAQEVWIQIFRALPSYRGDSQFSTWAHRIAVNRTLNALRKTRRLASLESEVNENSASVEPDTDRAFLAQSIEEATAKLSPGARAVFTMHDVEGYTHEEIAEELGITPGGSKSQLFKARAKLRKLLAHLLEARDVKDVRLSPRETKHVAPVY
jgi:RNA polymerase sigma-70 factor (ECF subfamily)